MSVIDRAALPAETLAQLERDVARLASLAAVIRWGLALSPPAIIADVVVQDEYCHDALLPWGYWWLVFDTT